MQEGLSSFAEQYNKKEREIMPEDMKVFFVEARCNTYAANAEPEENPIIPGSKELRYDNKKLFYIKLYLMTKETNGFIKTTAQRKIGDGAARKRYRITAKLCICSRTPAARSSKDFNH